MKPRAGSSAGSREKIKVLHDLISGSVSPSRKGLKLDAFTAFRDGFSKARFVLFLTATRRGRPFRSISKQTCTVPSTRSRRATRGYSGATVCSGFRSRAVSIIRAVTGTLSSAAASIVAASNNKQVNCRITEVSRPAFRRAFAVRCGGRRLLFFPQPAAPRRGTFL